MNMHKWLIQRLWILPASITLYLHILYTVHSVVIFPCWYLNGLLSFESVVSAVFSPEILYQLFSFDALCLSYVFSSDSKRFSVLHNVLPMTQ